MSWFFSLFKKKLPVQIRVVELENGDFVPQARYKSLEYRSISKNGGYTITTVTGSARFKNLIEAQEFAQEYADKENMYWLEKENAKAGLKVKRIIEMEE